MVSFLLIIFIVLALTFAGLWGLAEREKKIHKNITILDDQEQEIQDESVILEKKLRDAIFDCQENIKKCDHEIHELCQSQLDLLNGIGKASYIHVKNKATFFHFQHPLTKEEIFYYSKDLKEQQEPDTVERSKNLVRKYEDRIQLINGQRKVFEEMIQTHEKNISKLLGLKSISKQDEKIKTLQKKLKSIESRNSIEQTAIYQELILKEINEGIVHQQECLYQYLELKKKYEAQTDIQSESLYKAALDELINKINLE